VINGILVSMVIYLGLTVPLHKGGVKYESGTWVERETGF